MKETKDITEYFKIVTAYCSQYQGVTVSESASDGRMGARCQKLHAKIGNISNTDFNRLYNKYY